MKHISLTQGKEAIVSDCDYEWLTAIGSWCYLKSKKNGGYAVRRGPGGKSFLYMHREIAKRKGITNRVDHKDQDKLNNQRDNLRSATNGQNMINCGRRRNNTSGITGVSWYKGAWCVECGGKYVGRFQSKLEVATAYNHAALTCYGEFATVQSI